MYVRLLKIYPKQLNTIRVFLPWASDQDPAKTANIKAGRAYKYRFLLVSS